MRPINDRLTAERARHLFSYEPDTGSLRWRNPTCNAVSAGDDAGTGKHGGQRYVSVDGSIVMAHRLVWLMTHGELPSANIAAVNGDYSDLRLSNLKVQTFTETARKRKSSQRGTKGISFAKNVSKWHAEITRDYKRINLGYFATKEEAQSAYDAASVIEYPKASDADIRGISEARRKDSLLRSLWTRTTRDNPADQIAWASFLDFSKSIGDGAFRQARVVAVDPKLPIGPENFRVEPRAKFDRGTPEGRIAYYRDRSVTDKDRYREHALKDSFGITLDEYTQMLKSQNGVCAICEQPETWIRKGTLHALSVDHNHATGEIRDLLCRACNNAIGHFRENPTAMRRAADYIERHASKSKDLPSTNVVRLKTKK